MKPALNVSLLVELWRVFALANTAFNFLNDGADRANRRTDRS
jgi:hypothetical protein